MVLVGEQEPWKSDDILVSALSVEWIAKNVFLVAVPSYRRKVSCELTAVDVPRGTQAVLTERIGAILRQVNSAMRVYLRQDFYSNFPLEGYGDVIFSAETKQDAAYQLHWCSLQESLVRAGVACVVRPSVVRQAALLKAENTLEETPRDFTDNNGNDNNNEGGRCTSSSSWLHQLHQRERSPLCCMQRRCVVADVLRGDVYRVSWHPDAPSAAVDLPLLLILDATVCHTVSTQPGFAALRWAQLHLLHRELVVDVHAVYPCDRDVAFNTQLEAYEHLANVRGSASVLGADGATEDVGVALVSRGLAWVRRVADAGVPRASNLFALFRTVAEGAAETIAALPRLSSADAATGKAPAADAVVCAQLGKAWGLPAAVARELLAFHDAWWQHACLAAFLAGGDRQLLKTSRFAAATTATAAAPAGATATVWQRYMWCADVHKDPNDEPKVYIHRPLRTLFPLAGLAQWRVRLRGHVDGAAVVVCGSGRRFLQVEVTAVTSAAEWREQRRCCGYSDVDVVCFSPTPGDAVLGKSVRVTITVSNFGSDVKLRLRVCCNSYPARNFSLAQHTPSDEWSVKEGGWCEEVLSIDGTAKEERVFVLDVVVEASDEDSMTWAQRGTGRAVYLLSPDVDPEAVELSKDEEGEEKANGSCNAAAAKNAAERLKNGAVLPPSPYYLSKLSFFFELDAAPMTMATADGGVAASRTAEGLLAHVKRTFADLLYEDVVALPVGVAEVCGVRGLVGDILFPSEPAPRTAAAAGKAKTEGEKNSSLLLRERAPVVFTRSLLTAMGSSWWPDAASAASPCASRWPMSTAIYDAVQASFILCLERLAKEEWAARQNLRKEVKWGYQVLEQEALNTFFTFHRPTPFEVDSIAPPIQAAPSRCLYFAAGQPDLWRDSAANTGPARLRLPSSLLPPTVPLTLFAIRPRELFSVASSQKMRTTAQRKDATLPATLQEESYDQQDWAFMRLRFPFLPNILHCDWERLPLSLRNTERALCESIVQGRGAAQEPDTFYTTDRIFSLFLSYLALLHAMLTSGDTGGTAAPGSLADPLTPLTAVYKALQQSTPSFWDDCKLALHFSATLFVLPPYRGESDAGAVKHSRPLFLGSRDNIVSDAFEVPRRDNAAPEVVPFPFPRELTTRCVAAVGVESLVEAEEEEEDSEHQSVAATPAAAFVVNLDENIQPDQLRPITSQGLPWRLAQASTPVLYHPLPRLAVLASPLVERDEYAPDTLGRLQLDRDIFAGVQAENAEAALVRRRMVLRYRCMNKFSEKSPYKTISYGRVSSVDMFKTLLSDRAHGKEVQAYMSLLLRRNVKASATANAAVTTKAEEEEEETELPDGLLTLHGVPAEPLYVHYRSRADLRFTFSTVCSPLRNALLQAERKAGKARAAAVKAAETDLLQLYAEEAVKCMRKIYERVRRSEQDSGEAAEQISLVFTLQPWEDMATPYIAIQVFPVHPTDAEVTERVLDQEGIWHDETLHQKDPHRAFSLIGSRFGRLPLAEVRIVYDAVNNRFDSTWNSRLEDDADAAMASIPS